MGIAHSSWSSRIGALALVAMTVGLVGCPTRAPTETFDDGPPLGPRPRIILFIGDGMGKNQELIASRYLNGQDDGLVMHRLPIRGEILSASISGLTDSAAAATAMSSGQLTFNGRIGIDRNGDEVTSIFELARDLGMGTGLVTTTALPHATPAAFAAHRPSRGQLRDIATDFVYRSQPTVLLGGGATYFEESLESGDLVPVLRQLGYSVVESRTALAAAAGSARKLAGLFAPVHLPYVRDRADSDTIPDLPQMTRAALDVLDRVPAGFVLVVEGGRIDHGGHANLTDHVIHETLELDETIAMTIEWAEEREQVTMLVTADHETGGLDPLGTSEAGETPEVTWRWGSHTNRRVNIYGRGDGLDLIDGTASDHRVVFELLRSKVLGRPAVAPDRALLPNGSSSELRYLACDQDVQSNFGPRGQLDAIRVDADEHGIGIGIDGTYSFEDSAVVVFFDSDFGTESGARALTSQATSEEHAVDQLLAKLDVSLAVEGFGSDFVAVSSQGAESRLEGPIGSSGWRALDSSGTPMPASHDGVAINYDDGIRDRSGLSVYARAYSGLELGVPLDRLYPEGLPAGATLGIALALTSADGSERSNQALPPWTDSQTISKVIVVELDRDRDGEVDDDLVVSVRP